MSPGTISPILNTEGHAMPNSIADIEQQTIGGVKQSLIIRGENKENPVL